jgi:uncharacterized protein DUF6927
MGTYGGYTSRNQLAAEVTKTYESDDQRLIALKKFFSGNDLWVLFERTSKVAPTDVERFIVLFKISRWAKDDWAYKPVSEDMGPLEHSCPLSFIESAQHPHPNGYPEGWHDWREAVRQHHAVRAARRTQAVKVGDTVKLTNGKDYRIVSVEKRGRTERIRGLDSTGCVYRIPRTMLIVAVS